MILVAAVLLTSCTDHKVFDKYANTPVAGWEKNDTLKFNVPRMKKTNVFRSDLGLRINGSYPFMGLTLIVEQTVYPGQKTHVDTLNCKLRDDHGYSHGIGLSYYQYNFHITDMLLHEGDSLEIKVRHDMKREILPGISDIGIMLSRH